MVNLADVVIPNGNSGMTNMVTTNIRTAYVTVIKSVDKVFPQPSDVLTYTLTLNNAGNVAAYNVVVTDAIPSGATFVNGSLVGATGTLPTLTLNSPLQVAQLSSAIKLKLATLSQAQIQFLTMLAMFILILLTQQGHMEQSKLHKATQ